MSGDPDREPEPCPERGCGRAAPPLTAEQTARVLDHTLFAQIAGLFDLSRLYDLEDVLAMQIGCVVDDPDAGAGIARALVDRALLRIACAPRRLRPWPCPGHGAPAGPLPANEPPA